MAKRNFIRKTVTITIYIILAMLIGDGKSHYDIYSILIRLACGYTLGSLNYHIANFLERLLS